ncbi:unnamed protein product [Phaeothamnion confervicola]
MVPPRGRGGGAFLKAGLPLVAFLVGGSLMLSTFVGGGVEARDRQRQARSVSARQFDIEEEHKKIMAQMDLGDLKIVRVPRPNEGSNPAGK